MWKQIDSYTKGTWQLARPTPTPPPLFYLFFAIFDFHQSKAQFPSPPSTAAAAAAKAKGEHEMVGLSVILENYEQLSAKPCPQVISKGSMIKPASPKSPDGFSWRKPLPLPLPSFLDNCFLCNLKLLPGKDIYMYKGEQAFCSDECRCRQMFIDEEEAAACTAKGGCTREYNCSISTTSSPSTSSRPSRAGKGPSSRRNAFAY